MTKNEQDLQFDTPGKYNGRSRFSVKEAIVIPHLSVDCGILVNIATYLQAYTGSRLYRDGVMLKMDKLMVAKNPNYYRENPHP